MPKENTVTLLKYAPGVLIEKDTDVKSHPYYVKHYGQLVGKTIKQVVLQMFEGDPRQLVPYLVFEDNSSAAVMMDPEGNGPGHLDIQKP